jgi:hypothetical protein
MTSLWERTGKLWRSPALACPSQAFSTFDEHSTTHPVQQWPGYGRIFVRGINVRTSADSKPFWGDRLFDRFTRHFYRACVERLFWTVQAVWHTSEPTCLNCEFELCTVFFLFPFEQMNIIQTYRHMEHMHTDSPAMPILSAYVICLPMFCLPILHIYCLLPI